MILSELQKILVRISLAFTIALFCFYANVFAQEYDFDTWTTANGLPQNTVNGLVQTPDGYLWLSTFDGLARFDGVRFTIFDKGNTKGIADNRFTELLLDKAGALWSLTENGVITIYRDGIFTSYQIPETFKIPIKILLDGAGEVLIVTKDKAYYLRDGTFVESSENGNASELNFFYGKSGAKWTFAANGILWEKAGQTINYSMKFWTYDLPFRMNIYVQEDSTGSLWFTIFDKLYRLGNGKISVFTKEDIPDLEKLWLAALYKDADGTQCLIFGTYAGSTKIVNSQLVKFRDNQFTSYDLGDPTWVSSVRVDREGNIWFATQKGLKRLRRKLISTLSVKDGLNSDEVYPLLQTVPGDILIGSTRGVNRYASGKITKLDVNYGAGIPILSGGISVDFSNGRWFGYTGGFGRFENGSFKEMKHLSLGSATDFNVERGGNVWISTGEGLFKYKDDKEIGHYTTNDGLPHVGVVLTHLDRNGNLWAGTFNGLAIFKDGRFSDFNQESDSPKGYVRAIFEDADGVLWFGTYADGLYRYKDGKFFNYRVENGLFNNGVFAILEDGGNFWMSSNRGIHRVSIQELNDFADGKIPKINSISYDEKDGMLNAECNGGRIPAAIKTKDGKLWFGTMGGVAIVDPNVEKVNSLPPSVVIENISIDRKIIDAEKIQSAVRNPQSEIELQPGQSNIAIEYTGLSLIRSEQIKFRYKLEGLEENWIEAGTKRTVDYSYLPAGSYTFHVMAANGDGVWSEEGTAIKIIVHPYFYKTWWFIGLCVLAVAALIWWIYHTRVSRLRAIADAKTLFSRQLIESQEAERKRIASELHDGLGQSLVIIKNRAMLGIRKGDDKQRVAKELDNISESASQALDEVREITNNLRPQLLDRLGLTKAINSMLKKGADIIEIESEIDNIDGLFGENEEISVYRIVQESLNNVIKHAEATRVAVKIKRTENQVLITIEDNGKGFDPENVSSGHGLFGLKERALLLNGELLIDSKIGKGTKLTLELQR
jgi:signal transduction histidine kinase/ligand-binding sensor domain-containing protein